ncbi:hypothetical protein J2T55_001712 [Methylohalomonas lacus]|uniref:Uncharacterized protein n=1 Tax=Methylohalomonas lacus TaxID=398773 RepID=A0AAE3L4D4_9GAMM|nr:hypothetical protein [Methylohalomonas lacus]MCS3903683.1 hypothetical protein [Methylohalomonas lacus]
MKIERLIEMANDIGIYLIKLEANHGEAMEDVMATWPSSGKSASSARSSSISMSRAGRITAHREGVRAEVESRY